MSAPEGKTHDRIHLILVQTSRSANGGMGSYVRQLSSALAQLDQDVTVLTVVPPRAGWTDPSPHPQVEYVSVSLTNVHAVVRAIGRRLPAVLRLLTPDPDWVRQIEVSLAVRRGIRSVAERAKEPVLVELFDQIHGSVLFRNVAPYVLKWHGSPIDWLHFGERPCMGASTLPRLLKRDMLRHASFVSTPSAAMRDHIRRFYGWHGASVIPLPIAMPHNEDLADTNEPEYTHETKRVLFVGRFERRKGIDVLMRAAVHILDAPGAIIELVGEPTPEVSVDELSQLVPLDLQERVIFHGYMPPPELGALYASADVCVVPSRRDNSPNVIYEAMVRGRAVVATNQGGIPELVVDGLTGRLVPPDDPIALGTAIANLLREDDVRHAMGAAARRRAAEYFDPLTIARRTLAVYGPLASDGDRSCRRH